MKQIAIQLMLIVLQCGWLVADQPQLATDQADELLFLDNGTIKIGLNRSKGASISWLSWNEHRTNVVNHADPGRLIQQSYYAGRTLDRQADGQSPAWSPWSWNPIQGGGVGSWARVVKLELRDQTLYGETIPKLWDMPNEEAAAVMRQWTQFEPGMPNVVVVKCQFESRREKNDRWGDAVKNSQEIPACYFTRKFSRFRSYLGNGQWREETQPPGPPWGIAKPPRNAMGCFCPNGQGIVVFSPSATHHWNFGPHGGGASDNPAAGPCIHIAPIDRVPLGPQSTYRYRYWLTVGTAEQIAVRLDTLWERYRDDTAKLQDP